MYLNQPLIKIIGDPVAIRALKMLRNHSEGMTGRSLGALISTSPFKINSVLRHLVSQGVLTQTAVGKAYLYRLNRDHILVTDAILPLLDFESRLLQQLGQWLMDELKPAPLAIVLYGSVARGTERPDSDIDLLLVYDKDVEPAAVSDMGEIIRLVSQRYGNPAFIKSTSVTELQKPSRELSPLMRNIVKEGKSIAGLSIIELLNYNDQIH